MVASDEKEEKTPTARSRIIVVLLLTLAAIAALTGLALLPFYQAAEEGAYRSVQTIEQSVSLRLVRGIHHWASALILVAGGFYLLHAVLFSAYRRPRHRIWVASVGLIVVCLLFQVTGHLLPWDTHAVRTAVVETAIAGNVPLVGGVPTRLLRGGEAVGPGTLSVWYGAHIVLLPVALLILMGLLLQQLRRFGVSWAVTKAWMAASVGLLLVMALALRSPLGPAATPADYGSYDAKPEWYVLPLHSLLTFFQSIHPGLTFIGTIVIPGFVLAFLLALPWLDNKARDASPPQWVRAAAAGALVMVILLLLNAGPMAPLLAGQQAADVPAANPPQPAVSLEPALVAAGKGLFDKQGCISCHSVGGKGGDLGPDLSGTGTRNPDLDWQIRHLKEPSSVEEGSTMPSFKRLSEADLRALAIYMLSLK